MRRALIPHEDGVIVSEPKTAKGRRQIALDAVTVEAFKAQAALQLADRDDGQPLHPQSVSRAFGRAIAAAKLARIRLHDLRHTHATLALHANVNPKVISRAPRARDRLDHPRHLLARDPGATGGGGGANRGAGAGRG